MISIAVWNKPVSRGTHLIGTTPTDRPKVNPLLHRFPGGKPPRRVWRETLRVLGAAEDALRALEASKECLRKVCVVVPSIPGWCPPILGESIR